MVEFLIDYTEEERKDIFYKFYDSGLHKRNNEGERTNNWPRENYCVFQINSYEPVVARNFVGEEHAEILMMDYLSEFKYHGGQVDVYTNYSPCSDCADNLIEFVCDPEWEMELSMFFVQLYRVNRQSCKYDPKCKCRGNKANENGLRYLEQHVTLRHFIDAQWESLATLLQVENTSDDSREREDQEICNDFQHILNLY